MEKAISGNRHLFNSLLTKKNHRGFIESRRSLALEHQSCYPDLSEELGRGVLVQAVGERDDLKLRQVFRLLSNASGTKPWFYTLLATEFPYFSIRCGNIPTLFFYLKLTSWQPGNEELPLGVAAKEQMDVGTTSSHYADLFWILRRLSLLLSWRRLLYFFWHINNFKTTPVSLYSPGRTWHAVDAQLKSVERWMNEQSRFIVTYALLTGEGPS